MSIYQLVSPSNSALIVFDWLNHVKKEAKIVVNSCRNGDIHIINIIQLRINNGCLFQGAHTLNPDWSGVREPPTNIGLCHYFCEPQ